MNYIQILNYISFGFAFIVGGIAFASSDYLWKKSFFSKCLIASIISGVFGLIFEFTNLFQFKTGLTAVVMLSPLIELGYFQFFRWIFKKWNGTEPYITSVSSVVGAIPLDIDDKDGKKRKYPKDRKIMASDFAFTFLYGLGAIFTILFLLFFVFEVQNKP